jgi:hypothetical protein
LSDVDVDVDEAGAWAEARSNTVTVVPVPTCDNLSLKYIINCTLFFKVTGRQILEI